MIKITFTGNLKEEIKQKTEEAKRKRMAQLVQALKDATPVDTGNARDHWVSQGDKIVNETEYIDLLNQGSSKQAPEYFIEKTLLAQKDIIPSGTIVRSK